MLNNVFNRKRVELNAWGGTKGAPREEGEEEEVKEGEGFFIGFPRIY